MCAAALDSGIRTDVYSFDVGEEKTKSSPYVVKNAYTTAGPYRPYVYDIVIRPEMVAVKKN